MRIRFSAIAASVLLATAASAQTIPVPSDPRAAYEALEIRRLPNGNREILTRRVGPLGTSYALREVDCRRNQFRYLGEGDTAEQARRRSSSNVMGALVDGSISWHVSRFACR